MNEFPIRTLAEFAATRPHGWSSDWCYAFAERLPLTADTRVALLTADEYCRLAAEIGVVSPFEGVDPFTQDVDAQTGWVFICSRSGMEEVLLRELTSHDVDEFVDAIGRPRRSPL